MKKLHLMVYVSLLLTTLVKAQTIDLTKTSSTPTLQDHYTRKYKTYKTAGWFFLGSGITMTLVGGISFARYASQGLNGATPSATDFILIGPGVALASIPFFILARKNKRKADLAFKEESFSFGNKPISKSNYVAIALTIQL